MIGYFLCSDFKIECLEFTLEVIIIQSCEIVSQEDCHKYRVDQNEHQKYDAFCIIKINALYSLCITQAFFHII